MFGLRLRKQILCLLSDIKFATLAILMVWRHFFGNHVPDRTMGICTYVLGNPNNPLL